MIKDLEVVALTRPVPEYGLVAGDVGTVVMVYDGGKGFTVEFMTVKGKTIAIVTLESDAIRPVEDREIANARQVA
ncbi:MAG: DUF4926 domain-containing protein [Hyphomicrobium sp.]|nr:MAG: DUF4926 domain-containing protein [Hyphomicrobium sp.]